MKICAKVANFIENMYLCLDYDCSRGYVPSKRN